MQLPQGVPQYIADKLKKKARGEFGGEAVVEEQTDEQAVPSAHQSPAQADERQGRQYRGEVAQEKQLEPDSKESKESRESKESQEANASASLQRFGSIVASLAVPIGSGLLPCTAGAFLLYQAIKKRGFMQIPQDPVGEFDWRRSESTRYRSGRRY